MLILSAHVGVWGVGGEDGGREVLGEGVGVGWEMVYIGFGLVN